MTTRRKLVVGNWKMNGSRAANAELLAGARAGRGRAPCDVAVCVPFPYLSRGARSLLAGSAIALGRAGLLGARAGRLHRRGVGGDAAPSSAAATSSSATRSARQYHARERRSWSPTRPRPRWRTASRRSSASARRWPSARPAQTEAVVKRQLVGGDPHARRIASARSSSPTSRCGPSAPARPRRPSRRRRCTRCCARSCTPRRRTPPSMQHPLRRQRQARQRRAAVRPARHRRRPDRRRLAEGRRLRRHLPRGALNGSAAAERILESTRMNVVAEPRAGACRSSRRSR